MGKSKAKHRRKIAVVTGTRAEYGLLYWLMKEIQADPELELQVLVTGMHLSPEFGSTWMTIEKDGFRIDSKIEMLLSSDSPVGIAKSTGLGTLGFADALDRLKPDILVVLGDRFEILAAVTAATMMRIPIAHIHGGESTEGLIDEQIRHSVTKMSHLHFTAAEIYRERIIRMGESPDRVFFTGTPGSENFNRIKLLPKREMEKHLNFSLPPPVALVTYHPVTLEGQPEKPFGELLRALSDFPVLRIVFTMPNSDADGRIISEMINNFARTNPEKVRYFKSLGQQKYLSLMHFCNVVVGNSSSGIIEAPICGKPTVNIGNRQKGRLKASSVIDCKDKRNSISNAIRLALSPAFVSKAKKTISLYGSGNVSIKMKTILKNYDLEKILEKGFFDKGEQ